MLTQTCSLIFTDACSYPHAHSCTHTHKNAHQFIHTCTTAHSIIHNHTFSHSQPHSDCIVRECEYAVICDWATGSSGQGAEQDLPTPRPGRESGFAILKQMGQHRWCPACLHHPATTGQPPARNTGFTAGLEILWGQHRPGCMCPWTHPSRELALVKGMLVNMKGLG